MTQFLLRLFFRQLPDPADPTARGKIGIFSGIVGIFCNPARISAVLSETVVYLNFFRNGRLLSPTLT